MEHIFNLKTVLRIKAIRGTPTLCTYTNFKKAYDSIDRESLFSVLEERGFDRKM